MTLTALSNSHILRSDNKGVNWSHVSYGYYSKITGTGVTNSGISVGGRRIKHTTDNGITFSDAGFASFGELFDLVMDSNSGTGYTSGSAGILLKTSDQDLSWFELLQNDSLVREYWLTAINQIDSNKVYIVGHNWNGTKLFKSNDGFVTYSILDFPYSIFGNKSISFNDENTGITKIGENERSIALTTDGGLTWSSIAISNQNTIDAVKFINGICFATAKSTIYRSSDLGLTWTETQLDDSYFFLDIYSPSPSEIYMSGYLDKS